MIQTFRTKKDVILPGDCTQNSCCKNHKEEQLEIIKIFVKKACITKHE